MSRILVIVGASTTGKTALAHALARVTGAAAVICGDQWQLVSGFPIATGIAEATASVTTRLELYGILHPTVTQTLSCADYAKALDAVLARYQGMLVVVEGLSFAYFDVLPNLRARHEVLVIGLRPRWATMPFRLLARMWRALRKGVLREIRNGVAIHGQGAWYVKNSYVARDVSRYGPLLGGWWIFWTTLTGEAIRGKHHRIAASGAVDCWL